LVFDEVQAELEAQGYEVTPFLLPACSVNAPHRRDRIWFIAYSASASKRANELRCLRSENGEIDREGSQTIYDAIRSNGIEGTSADSNLFRCDQRIKYDEVNTGEGGVNAFSHIDQTNVNGDVTNSEFKGLQGCTDAGEISRKEGTLGSEGNKFTTQFASINKESNASNSSCIQLQGSKLNGSFESKRSFQRKSGQFSRPIFSRWEKFPTVAPICDGNDGISNGLDGITFPKWRNESIKAGGNAIVPQVVYQIFKAINQYNQLNNQLTL
jgi:DNA (cytosine-5)-methyltransferase 1